MNKKVTIYQTCRIRWPKPLIWVNSIGTVSDLLPRLIANCVTDGNIVYLPPDLRHRMISQENFNTEILTDGLGREINFVIVEDYCFSINAFYYLDRPMLYFVIVYHPDYKKKNPVRTFFSADDTLYEMVYKGETRSTAAISYAMSLQDKLRRKK